jgi:hypothetical protein
MVGRRSGVIGAFKLSKKFLYHPNRSHEKINRIFKKGGRFSLKGVPDELQDPTEDEEPERDFPIPKK